MLYAQNQGYHRNKLEISLSYHSGFYFSRTELWTMKLNDSVLDLVYYRDNIICALADGYIAAICGTDGKCLPSSDPVLYRIGSMAVQCMIICTYDRIWVGCGRAITILEAE